MTSGCFNFPNPYTAAAPSIPVLFLTAGPYAAWLKSASNEIRSQMSQTRFSAKPGECALIFGADGRLSQVLLGCHAPLKLYDSAVALEYLRARLSEDALKSLSFHIGGSLSPADLTKAAIGWGLAAYGFEALKSEKSKCPVPPLVWPEGVSKEQVTATVEAICLLRNLINLPANVLGTDELADAAREVADRFKAAYKETSGDDLLKENFPLIHAVGDSSPRRPLFVEMTWGNPKHPAVAIVGKGIVFDTGGLNLKTGQWMSLMKKDMGGAAHALALSWLVMKLNLPVHLRTYIAIAENAVSGRSMRPGDVVKSRKGITVEIGDTDAEGRLVVADAVAAACEAKPEMLIDFTTLTGSARAALGYDIPAFFSNRDALLDDLRKISRDVEDPIWPLPLWEPYLKEMDSKVADINNIGKGLGGAIHGALFISRFVTPSIDWVHLDLYAWEQNGRPGRPVGGTDMGLRSLFTLLETRYKKT